MGSEHEFRSRLPFFREKPPHAFVLGAWFRWVYPSQDMPEAPQDVIEGDYHRNAGLRCQRLLAGDPRTANVLVIIWDAFHEIEMQKMFGDTPSNVHFLTKASEYYTDDLARKVQAVISTQR